MVTHEEVEVVNEVEPKTTKRRALQYVGYTRVSTKKQATEGISLAGQEDMLRSFASQKRAKLLGIHQDEGSAYSATSSAREGFLAAIGDCRTSGASLLVPSIDRLSRNVSALKELDVSGLRIVSVKEGLVGKERLRILIQKAQHDSEEISRRSRESAANRKARGARLGNRTNLSEAQRRGTFNNLTRKNKKIEELAACINADSDLQNLTWNKRAERLNALNHWNLCSDRNSRREPWTVGSLRKPWKEALALLEEWRELAEGDDPWITSGGGTAATTASDSIGEAMPPRGAITTQKRPSVGGMPLVTSSALVASEGPSQGLVEAAASVAAVAQSRAAEHITGAALPTVVTRQMKATHRPLTPDELNTLETIMGTRGLSNCDVMDELGLKRLNASIWTAQRRGTQISIDTIERLQDWFRRNAGCVPASS